MAHSLDELRLWKVPLLQQYCKERGLSVTSKRKDELVSLAFAASCMQLPVTGNKEQEKATASSDYSQLLTLRDGTVIPDPLKLRDGWVGEKDGVSLWPPCMILNISDYLLQRGDRPLCERLRNDYKEGKAFSYFQSQESWIQEVSYHAVSDNSAVCLLKSTCAPSQRLNNIHHTLWACIDKNNGGIEQAYCTCMAGLGSTCNHVAALLFKVDFAWKNGLTQGHVKPCTSERNMWLVPALRALEPMKASDMVFEKPTMRRSAACSRRMTVRQSTVSRRLFGGAEVHSSKMPTLSLDDFSNALFPDCSSAVAFRYSHFNVQPQYDPSDDLNIGYCEEVTAVEQDLLVSFVESCRHLHSVQEVKMLSLSCSQVQKIEKETRGQSDNDLWFQMREGRISASIVRDVYTRTRSLLQGASQDCTSLKNLCLSARTCRPDLPALVYGKETESEAVSAYSAIQRDAHSDCHVTECGLFVDETRPYLCATPDAVVSCDCCGDGLLEVKCPLTSAGKHPHDAGLPYLHLSDGKVILRRSHKYYAQVQCQMAVTKRSWCDFFVYSKEGHHLERIDFDASYWGDFVETVTKGFFDYVVPSMISST